MTDCFDKKDHKCCIAAKHPNPKKIIFECGLDPKEANFVTEPENPINTEDPVTLVQNFTLDRVLIDVNRLFRPIAKIEFSSLILYNILPGVSNFRIELQFQLNRKCDNGPDETRRTWIFKKDVELQEDGQDFDIYNVREPFTVTFCESLLSCDCLCCEYTMVVTATAVKSEDSEITSDFVNIETARVTKPSLSVFAQGECFD